MTDDELTALYNEANGISGKRLPITTQRIFTAMRAAHGAAFRDGYEKGVAAFHEAVKMEREDCANICDHEHGTAGDAAVKIRMRSNER